jgi:transcriptional regulator with XRE-family HTH domain
MKLEDLIPFEQILEEEPRDPEFRAEWERLAPARAVANRLILYRAEHGLTQTALGRRLGMPQSAIARLEIGEHIPTLSTLLKISDVLGLEILVTMMPRSHNREGDIPELRNARVTENVLTAGGASMTIAIR